jgi:four helix bundle protein
MANPIIEVRSYQDLIAWRKAMSLVIEVYKSTANFPRHEIYGLSSQLRRAAVSIPSNVAEGHGRATSGEFVQFLCHARGSLCEVETQVIIARELAYITGEQEHLLTAKTDQLGRVLQGLIASIQRRKSNTAHRSPAPNP